jgi:hypothetical protein
MRLIFSLLIFAITLSGFLSAAHAFEPVSVVEAQAMGMACDNYQPDNSGDTHNRDGVPAKGCDMGCHSCCSGNAALLSELSVHFPIISIIQSAFHTDALTGDYVFSLLRPPRNLV